jgi:hypothetical protein
MRDKLVERQGHRKDTVSIENLKVALALLQRLLHLSSGFQVPILAGPQASLLSTVQLITLQPHRTKREKRIGKNENA